MGSLTVRSKTNLKETELTYWQVGKCRISSRNITTTKTTSSQDTQQLSWFWLEVTILCFLFFVQAPLTFSFQMWLERIPARKYFTSSPEIQEKKVLKLEVVNKTGGRKQKKKKLCKAWTSILLSTSGRYLQQCRGLQVILNVPNMTLHITWFEVGGWGNRCFLFRFIEN